MKSSVVLAGRVLQFLALRLLWLLVAPLPGRYYQYQFVRRVWGGSWVRYPRESECSGDPARRRTPTAEQIALFAPWITATDGWGPCDLPSRRRRLARYESYDWAGRLVVDEPACYGEPTSEE